jgi:hypothetical protein
MTLHPGIPSNREKGKPEGFVVTDITRKPRVARRSSISMAAGQNNSNLTSQAASAVTTEL